MRSVPAGSFQHLSSFPCLWVAWLDYRRGKRRRPAVADFALDADLALLHLHQALRAGHFRPSNYRVALVRDPKLRLVAAPNVGDRVLQRALLDAIGPTYERGFIHHNYAVGTGRGAHRAALAYLGWMRRLPWRMHLDISHYFASVEHERLMSLFARRLRDARTLDLLASLLAAGAEVYRHPLAEVALPELRVPPGRGLPLGGYLSHWAGGFYLDSLDHLVTRTLKPGGYLRYMDDFVLFADRPETLDVCRARIIDWLDIERGLRLKVADAPALDNRQPGVFLGFRISRGGIGPGPKALKRLRRRLRRGDDLNPAHLARSLAAFRGMWRALG
jgi:RNA-directed DNA polymerase